MVLAKRKRQAGGQNFEDALRLGHIERSAVPAGGEQLEVPLTADHHPDLLPSFRRVEKPL
ncbi:hypothetical protein D3C77_717450 [compost metagenome]